MNSIFAGSVAFRPTCRQQDSRTARAGPLGLRRRTAVKSPTVCVLMPFDVVVGRYAKRSSPNDWHWFACTKNAGAGFSAADAGLYKAIARCRFGVVPPAYGSSVKNTTQMLFPVHRISPRRRTMPRRRQVGIPTSRSCEHIESYEIRGDFPRRNRAPCLSHRQQKRRRQKSAPAAATPTTVPPRKRAGHRARRRHRNREEERSACAKKATRPENATSSTIVNWVRRHHRQLAPLIAESSSMPEIETVVTGVVTLMANRDGPECGRCGNGAPKVRTRSNALHRGKSPPERQPLPSMSMLSVLPSITLVTIVQCFRGAGVRNRLHGTLPAAIKTLTSAVR